jgi:hypothetical protein
MDRSEFIAFLGQACRNLAAFSGDGAVIYICPWTGLPRLVQRPEPAIGIGLQKACEVREMGRWILTAAVGAVKVDCRRRCGATERPVVADIRP